MFSSKRYVLEVYKERSFSKAAKKLFISQPALSATIKRIEESIGEDLFDRSTSPISLTACGEEYIRTANEIAAAEENFRTYLQNLKGLKTGVLVLGGTNLNISYILPPILETFHKEYPDITLKLEEKNIEELEKALDLGEIDFLIDGGELDQKKFMSYTYQKESVILVIPKFYSCNDKLAEYRMNRRDIILDRHLDENFPVLPLNLIKDQQFILLKETTDTHKRAEKLFAKYGIKPSACFHLDQQSSAFNLACAGLGVTFVSDTLIKNSSFHPNLCYYKIDSIEGERYIHFHKKRGRSLTYAMQAFLRITQARL